MAKIQVALETSCSMDTTGWMSCFKMSVVKKGRSIHHYAVTSRMTANASIDICQWCMFRGDGERDRLGVLGIDLRVCRWIWSGGQGGVCGNLTSSSEDDRVRLCSSCGVCCAELPVGSGTGGSVSAPRPRKACRGTLLRFCGPGSPGCTKAALVEALQGLAAACACRSSCSDIVKVVIPLTVAMMLRKLSL